MVYNLINHRWMHNTREKSSIVRGKSELRSLAYASHLRAPHACAFGSTISRCDCTYVYVYSAAKLAPHSASRPVCYQARSVVRLPAPGVSLSMICSSRTNLPRASRHFECSKAIVDCITNIENWRATPIYLWISGISCSRKHPTDRSYWC